jgi:N-acylneuraminate cytidylyltransferase
MKRVLGYIPARGGSKGVPGKNKKILGNKPLIAYTILAAQQSTCITECFVSTDDSEIASIANSYGIEMPRMRPAHLAQDSTPMLEVMQDDIAFLASLGKDFDYVIILQPTNPFRSVGFIDACFEKLAELNADTLVSTAEVPQKYNPHWVFEENQEGYLKISTGEEQIITRRQLLPVTYIRDGSVYIFKTALLQANTFYGPKLVGHPINQELLVNVDTPEDWQLAVDLLESFLAANPQYK